MGTRLGLHIVFRQQGLKWPLRDDDHVEVWTDGHELVATVPIHVIRHMVELHLAQATIQYEVNDLMRPPVKMSSRSFRPFEEQRVYFRARRRSRKPQKEAR